MQRLPSRLSLCWSSTGSIKLAAVFVLALLAASCTSSPPIPHSKFVELYVQLQLIDARYGQNPAVHKAKTDSLLKAFNVTGKLVDSTLSWYGRDPDRLKLFFDDAEKRMGDLRVPTPPRSPAR